MSIKRYIEVTGRLDDARRRGDDVDHYIDELHGLWSAMDVSARTEIRKLIRERKAREERLEVKRVAA